MLCWAILWCAHLLKATLWALFWRYTLWRNAWKQCFVQRFVQRFEWRFERRYLAPSSVIVGDQIKKRAVVDLPLSSPPLSSSPKHKKITQYYSVWNEWRQTKCSLFTCCPPLRWTRGSSLNLLMIHLNCKSNSDSPMYVTIHMANAILPFC